MPESSHRDVNLRLPQALVQADGVSPSMALDTGILSRYDEVPRHWLKNLANQVR